MKSVDELTELFRANGRKVTPQRQRIFAVLQADGTHPTAEAVHERAKRQMSTISLKTVYQTLHDLVQMGELEALDVGTGSIRFDPNVEASHHHLVCEGCGKVRDVHAALPALQLPAAARGGFDVSSAEVVFRGFCAQCSSDPDKRQERKEPHSWQA